MKLYKLLKQIDLKNYKNYENHHITSITDKNHEIIENSIFICINGYNFDGHNFVIQSIKNGAKTVFTQEKLCNLSPELVKKVNIIQVENTKKVFASLIYYFNKSYFSHKKIIGVTGTNGKTSTSTLIHEYLESIKKKSILVGSNGIYYKSAVYPLHNTTPTLKEIVQILSKIKKLKYKYFIIEVSSISIKENRILPLNFNVGIFTNLTIDHLDYHKTVTDYRYSKLLFLKSIQNKRKNQILLNYDDDTSFFYNKFLNNKNIVFYSLKNTQNSHYHIKKIKEENNQTHFTISDNPDKIYISNLFFDFSLYNILSSYLTLKLLKINLNNYGNFIVNFKNVSGRIDLFCLKERYFLIDFAHTPDAVKNILKMIDKTKYEKVRLIIGCGGQRDKLKRPIIGSLSVNYCDYVTFTNDNPRNENEKAIMADVLKSIPNYRKNYEIIYDRRKAIQKNVLESKKNEIIIILGKGAETYQIIENKNIPFNDKDIVLEYIQGVHND